MSISLNNHESRIKALENKTASESGIGYGKKWYDVTTKRAKDTVYTNTTGSPIMVNISDRDGSTSPTLFVDDVEVGYHTGGAADGTVSAIIPNNSKYKCTQLWGRYLWAELRSDNKYYLLSEKEVA